VEPLGEITLAIETSNPSAPGAPGVAVGQWVAGADAAGTSLRILSTASIADNTSAPKQRNEDRLMLAIDEAMNAAGLTPRHIKRIAVSLGPGGFTSVRLAVTTAKCIAEVTGAACVGVPTALIAATHFAANHVASNGDPLPQQPFVVALASKGDDAYVQIFTPTNAAPNSAPNAAPGVTPLTDGAVVDASGVATLARTHAFTTLLADAFLPEPMRAQAHALNIAIAPIHLDPVACLLASRGIQPVDPIALAPLYPREPEAVTKWRALHGDHRR
jgi:tRNA threonylcarbamoyl adenosine modification protein YeaZ